MLRERRAHACAAAAPGEDGGTRQHAPVPLHTPRAVGAPVTRGCDRRTNSPGVARIIAVAFAAALTLAVAGCASRPEPDPAQAAARLAVDRERLQAEADGAVAVIGRGVCRERRLGLAEREVERGVVLRDAQGRWRVRTDAGAEGPAQGAGWAPCR